MAKAKPKKARKKKSEYSAPYVARFFRGLIFPNAKAAERVRVRDRAERAAAAATAARTQKRNARAQAAGFKTPYAQTKARAQARKIEAFTVGDSIQLLGGERRAFSARGTRRPFISVEGEVRFDLNIFQTRANYDLGLQKIADLMQYEARENPAVSTVFFRTSFLSAGKGTIGALEREGTSNELFYSRADFLRRVATIEINAFNFGPLDQQQYAPRLSEIIVTRVPKIHRKQKDGTLVRKTISFATARPYGSAPKPPKPKRPKRKRK